MDTQAVSFADRIEAEYDYIVVGSGAGGGPVAFGVSRQSPGCRPGSGALRRQLSTS